MPKSKTTAKVTTKSKSRAKRREIPAIVLAACRTKQVNPGSLHSFQIGDVDVILNVKGAGAIRVEISALPANVVIDHFQPNVA